MRCKDIADKYNVTAMQVGRLRKKFFPDHDGGDLSQEEKAVLMAYFEDQEDLDTRKELEEAVQNKYTEGFVSYVQRGRREVECKVRGTEGIETIYALVPTNVDPINILHKTIPLEYLELDDRTIYRHASLANVAWPEQYAK